eukprot:3276674-Prymnesium_polylepis.1
MSPSVPPYPASDGCPGRCPPRRASEAARDGLPLREARRGARLLLERCEALDGRQQVGQLR